MQLWSWWASAPTFAVALLFLALTALISTAGIRQPVLTRFALGGVGVLVSAGIAGALAALVRVPFGWWQIVLVALLLGAATFLVPRAPRPASAPRPSGAIVGTAWVVSAAAVALVAFAGIASPTQFSQTYDNNFHLSAIAHILDTGNASSFQLRTLIETGKTFSYYPAGWHSLVAALVQLTGAPVTVAVNAMWFAIAAVIWLPGIGWLSTVVLPAASRRLTATVGILLGAAFGSFPYALLSWGTLYPTFVATAVLPATFAAGLLMLHLPGRIRLHWLTWLVLGCGAVAFAQPRTLASVGVLLAMPLAWSVARFARARLRAGGDVRRRFVRWSTITIASVFILGIVGGTYVWFRFDLAHRPIGDHLNGPQALAKLELGEAIWQSLTQRWLVGDGAAATWPSLLLAGIVLVGVVSAARRPSLRWLVASFVLVNLLFIAAVGSDSVLSKLLTGIWYKDNYRLSSLIPVVAVPLAVIGVHALTEWSSTRLARVERSNLDAFGRHPAFAVGLSTLTLATSVLVLLGSGMTAAIGQTFRLDRVNDGSAIVDQQQIEFFAQLRQIVPADELVLGDPWDGSGLTLLFGDRTPVFPHVNGQWDADRLVLAYQLTEIDNNPAVCAALDRLNVHYVVANAHTFGGGDPSGNHFAAIRAAVDAGHFTPVLTDGSNTLYRISECD